MLHSFDCQVAMGGRKFRLGRIRKNSEEKLRQLGKNKLGRPRKTRKTGKKVCDTNTNKLSDT